MEQVQAIVIGLGQFGMSVARALAANGTEVLVIDRNEIRVRTGATFATEALILDATDEEQLARLSPGRRDLCICAIGDEGREASILVTALLRQMGSRRVIARATDDLHERILRLVGAHEVVNPERIFGERLATRLLHREVVDLVPLGNDLEITEITSPVALWGRTLGELALPRRYQVTVVALRRVEESQSQLVLADGETRIIEGDILVLVGPKGAANRMLDRLQ